MLIGYLSLLSIGIRITYLIFDYFYGVQDSYTVYYVFLTGATLSFLANRNRYHFISKVILMSVALAIVCVFSTRGNFETDTHFFYITISISSFGLFGHEQRWMAFLFSGA